MRKSEIWIVELSDGKGHEQKGQRPAIVMGTANGLTTVVPLTSNLDKAKFSFTEFIEKTPHNHLSEDSIALVFQLVSLDNVRFLRKVGDLSKENQESIDALIVSMLKINRN